MRCELRVVLTARKQLDSTESRDTDADTDLDADANANADTARRSRESALASDSERERGAEGAKRVYRRAQSSPRAPAQVLWTVGQGIGEY